MDDQLVYVNTFAEGAIVGNPEEITPEQLPTVAKTWKRSNAIVHYRLFGLETVEWKGIRKEFLIGDIGSAKVMLPVDPEFSGIKEHEDPVRLLNYWVSAVVEDYDLEDEANPILILNRKKAIERLQQLNAKRVVSGGEAYGVIQAKVRGGEGGYILNVGGYPALLPANWYDWNSSKTGEVGEGFNVQIRDNENGRLTVSRCHLMPNPFDMVADRIGKGAKVRAKITHLSQGSFKAEIRPGVRIRVTAPTMYHMLHVGDSVLVRVRGKDKNGFYGIVV